MTFRTKILLLLFLVHYRSELSEGSLSYECPEPDEIFPCYCEDDDDDPWIHCNYLTTPEQLRQGVKGMKNYKLYKISFFKNQMTEDLDSDIFNGVTVDRILFENSTAMIKSPQFTGLEKSLSSLHLRACFNSTHVMQNWSLSHLNSLRELIVEKNKITTLTNDWLITVPDTLRSLTIESNKIVSLEDKVFAQMKKLTFLVLEDNRLTGLRRTMFPRPAEALRSINLNNNRLRYLPYDLFEDMPSLRMIEIANNRLTTLEDNIWSSIIPQLMKLSLEGNPLECDKSLKWILSTTLPVLMDGECSEPPQLKGRRLKSLTARDLN